MGIKVIVTKDKVEVRWGRETKICTFQDTVKEFNELDEFHRKVYAVNLWDCSVFETVQTVQTSGNRKRNPSTLSILEGCVHTANKFCSNEELEEELDSFIGNDPYLPLY